MPMDSTTQALGAKAHSPSVVEASRARLIPSMLGNCALFGRGSNGECEFEQRGMCHSNLDAGGARILNH